MPSLLTERDALVIVTRSPKRDLDQWALGLKACEISGKTLDELVKVACRDRIALADSMLQAAKKLARMRPPHFASSVSRAYYSMYHSARAVAFIGNRGDDFQEHSKLPSAIPVDFPDRDRWENELKNARLARNAADYDPYGDSVSPLAHVATQLEKSAAEFILACKAFLNGRGVQL